MTDLESEIRAALTARADEIHTDTLRAVTTRHRRAFWPVLAAAAVIAALAVGSALLLTRDRSGRDAHAAGGAAAPTVHGYSWRLTSISSKQRTVSAPAGSFVEFPGTQVEANDSVNFASGTFRRTADGFRALDATTTAAGYAGSDPRVLAAQLAVAAVMGGADVTARVNGAVLVLSVHGYTLRLVKQGRVTTAPTSASATPTR